MLLNPCGIGAAVVIHHRRNSSSQRETLLEPRSRPTKPNILWCLNPIGALVGPDQAIFTHGSLTFHIRINHKMSKSYFDDCTAANFVIIGYSHLPTKS